jgi:hypothetical protein
MRCNSANGETANYDITTSSITVLLTDCPLTLTSTITFPIEYI